MGPRPRDVDGAGQGCEAEGEKDERTWLGYAWSRWLQGKNAPALLKKTQDHLGPKIQRGR